MSSVVTTPAKAAAGQAPDGAPERRGRAWLNGRFALTFGAGVVVTSLLTKASFGGTQIGANTWTQIALVLLGAALVAAAVIAGGRGPAWGLGALLLFVVLAALTFASIGWSVQPADSWLEGNRTLSYLAVFAGAMALARIAPTRWPAVVGGVAVASVALSAWALLSKVFPATLDATDTFGRLSAPFGYWNAVGLAAALGLPACLWVGSRREAPRILRTLAVPALAVLLSALVLSYGRGALAAAVIGVALWVSFVDFRWRAAFLLLLAALGGAIPIVWALASHPLTHDNIKLAARVSAGHTFGLVLALTLAALSGAGCWAAVAVDRVTVPPAVRRRASAALLALAALIAVAGVVAMAASSRGLTGEISHIWNQLTNPVARTGDTSRRLVQVGSSRPTYWREGLLVGEHAALKGVGAAGFATASLRYVRDRWGVAARAHSYVIETFADFGAIGLLVSFALLGAWALAAARAVGVGAARAGPESERERVGLLTLLAVVVIFGLHSAIDWTWFVPGVALPALVCAGWLAGRGPLASPVGRLPAIRRLGAAPGAAAVVILVAAVALIGAWAIWQPLRAANADSAALAALARGDRTAAFADARAAAADNPVSTEPLSLLSSLYSGIHDFPRARLELVHAISLQPANPDTWEQLGEYELCTRQRPRAALAPLRHALVLSPAAQSIRADITNASAGLRCTP